MKKAIEEVGIHKVGIVSTLANAETDEAFAKHDKLFLKHRNQYLKPTLVYNNASKDFFSPPRSGEA